ncbi:heterokaryon incompatibility protein-domain-containing protein, partial [Lasiosphaeris hirsuta]
PYAILSHTWEKAGEVTFDDMRDPQVAMAKSGWTKIERTCALAGDQGIPFVWIDTCCIDKSSSAELTKAINSMYAWYKKARVCYTYLGDLPDSPNGDPKSRSARHQLQADLGRCRWFNRGWTLQELIAPRVVEFYDCSWTMRGTKALLCSEISCITDIDMEVLSNKTHLSTIPVARKMSWAARRQTTRVEDIAYSLLGIFDVNLPLIYGEGKKAFIRLQEAIAHSTNDLSLFAWSEDKRNANRQSYYGALAQSPQQFALCRQI